MDGNWAANVSLAIFTYILGVVFVNMIVARINSIYSTILRKGLFFYYRELFDLRYLYQLDPHYGYLASLEHPFSIILLPTLCIVRCL